MARIGYARVSSSSQNLAPQIDALKAAGCDPIRQESVSGGSRDGRSELESILAFVREGDAVIVTRLDRLGRNLLDVLNIVEDLDRKGAHLEVLDQEINTKGKTGRLLLHILAVVAETERQFIRERQRAGIERAKANGVYTGGKRQIDHAEAERLLSEGKKPAAAAKALGCSRQQIHRIRDGLIARWLDAGEQAGAIAERLHCNEKVVQRVLDSRTKAGEGEAQSPAPARRASASAAA